MSYQYKIMWVAEKATQAEKYAKAFASYKKGYIKEDKIGNFYVCSDPEYCNGMKTIITWASGHLLELNQPEDYDAEKYKTWKRDTLPIIPEEFLYKVTKSNLNQWKTVNYFMNMCDTIVWAGDLDREGSHISYLLSYYSGAWFDDNKTFKRLWVKDLLKPTIRKGFKSLKTIDSSYLQALAGQARAKADWLIGINGTRFISIILNELGFETPLPKSVGGVSVGRVMTPTLFLVYNRENEIENFTPRTYYTLSGKFEHINGSYEGKLVVPDITMKNGKKWKGEFDKASQWDTFLKRYAPNFTQGTITDKTSEVKYKRSPKLFTLNDLQQTMDKKAGIGTSDTLAIVQSLYDPKGEKSGDDNDTSITPDAYLTYPRSKSEYITEEEYFEMTKTAGVMADWFGISHDELVILDKPDGFYVNTEVCGECGHSAITPTANIPTKDVFESWDENTQAVYLEVLKRTFAMFLPKYEYQETVVITSVEQLQFKTTGKTPVKQGWKVLWEDEQKNKKKKEELISLAINDRVKPEAVVNEIVTKPPVLYTEGTLLNAMTTAGTKVPDDVETDEEAENLAKVMRTINGIGTEATRADTIQKLFEKKQLVKSKRKVRTTELGRLICRILEKEIIFSNPQVTAKWELSLKHIEEGKNDQETFLTNVERYLGVGSSDKNLFVNIDQIKASLDLSDFEDLKAEIQKKKNPIIEGVTCPVCGKRVKLYDEFIICEDNKKDSEGHQLGCDFILSTHVGRFKKEDKKRKKATWSGGKKLTEKQIISLLSGEEVLVKGIRGKNNKYDAPIQLAFNDATDRFGYQMNFEKRPEAKVIGTCPKCQGEVKLYDKVAKCANNTKEDATCDFIIFRNTCGVDLSDSDISQLLQFRETKEIKEGLYTGRGNPKVTGRLILNEEDKVVAKEEILI